MDCSDKFTCYVTHKCVISLLLVAFVLITSSVCFAAETTLSATPSAETSPSASIGELPAVHILPDNPLYFLKTIKEKVQLLVTRSTSSQANLLLDFSQKRLAEALKVAEKGKGHISAKLFEAFGRDIKSAQEKILQAKAAGEQTYGLLVKLRETVGYQKSVIEKIPALDSFFVEIDKSLEATESATIQQGLSIGDWLKSLFGKKEILSPIVK